jgi:Leucine-rich repeat (LRR) protein
MFLKVGLNEINNNNNNNKNSNNNNVFKTRLAFRIRVMSISKGSRTFLKVDLNEINNNINNVFKTRLAFRIRVMSINKSPQSSRMFLKFGLNSMIWIIL